MLDAVPHRVVRENVEFLLHFALHVDRTEFTEDVGEAGAAHLARDDLRRETEIVEEVRQLPGGFGVQPLLLHDVALNRDDGRR